LQQSAIAAQSICKSSQPLVVTPFKNSDKTPIYCSINPIHTTQQEVKIALLQHIDRLARSLDPRVIDVTVTLAEVTMIF